MTDAPSKRPWLQFHLSTAVVLMFVAAGLLWLNMVPYRILKYERVAGFPLWFYYSHDIEVGDDGRNYAVVNAGVHLFPALVDLVFAACILLLALHGCEWLIRRRERAHD